MRDAAVSGRRLFTRMPSPIGPLLIVGDEQALWSVSMDGQRWAPQHDPAWQSATEPFQAATEQLEAYFAGARQQFDLPLRLAGTQFQMQVWTALAEIPFGATCSYGSLAREVGRPSAARAVGLANGRNPFAIVLPCHRVVGSDGRLVGYGGGLQRKRWLLEHESKALGVLRGRRASGLQELPLDDSPDGRVLSRPGGRRHRDLDAVCGAYRTRAES